MKEIQFQGVIYYHLEHAGEQETLEGQWSLQELLTVLHDLYEKGECTCCLPTFHGEVIEEKEEGVSHVPVKVQVSPDGQVWLGKDYLWIQVDEQTEIRVTAPEVKAEEIVC